MFFHLILLAFNLYMHQDLPFQTQIEGEPEDGDGAMDPTGSAEHGDVTRDDVDVSDLYQLGGCVDPYSADRDPSPYHEPVHEDVLDGPSPSPPPPSPEKSEPAETPSDRLGFVSFMGCCTVMSYFWSPTGTQHTTSLTPCYRKSDDMVDTTNADALDNEKLKDQPSSRIPQDLMYPVSNSIVGHIWKSFSSTPPRHMDTEEKYVADTLLDEQDTQSMISVSDVPWDHPDNQLGLTPSRSPSPQAARLKRPSLSITWSDDDFTWSEVTRGDMTDLKR